MTSFRLNARRPIDPPADDGFEVSYVPDDGAVHRMPLARAWEMPLERSLPVRRFASRKGQRHLRGCGGQPRQAATWGSSPGWKHDHVLHLDFDPSVGIASQPLWLHWTDEGGPCFCRTPLADQVHRVLARMALLDSTGGYLVGPHPEAGQCGGTEGVAEGDVG